MSFDTFILNLIVLFTVIDTLFPQILYESQVAALDFDFDE